MNTPIKSEELTRLVLASGSMTMTAYLTSKGNKIAFKTLETLINTEGQELTKDLSFDSTTAKILAVCIVADDSAKARERASFNFEISGNQYFDNYVPAKMLMPTNNVPAMEMFYPFIKHPSSLSSKEVRIKIKDNANPLATFSAYRLTFMFAYELQ